MDANLDLFSSRTDTDWVNLQSLADLPVAGVADTSKSNVFDSVTSNSSDPETNSNYLEFRFNSIRQSNC